MKLGFFAYSPEKVQSILRDYLTHTDILSPSGGGSRGFG